MRPLIEPRNLGRLRYRRKSSATCRGCADADRQLDQIPYLAIRAISDSSRFLPMRSLIALRNLGRSAGCATMDADIHGFRASHRQVLLGNLLSYSCRLMRHHLPAVFLLHVNVNVSCVRIYLVTSGENVDLPVTGNERGIAINVDFDIVAFH